MLLLIILLTLLLGGGGGVLRSQPLGIRRRGRHWAWHRASHYFDRLFAGWPPLLTP
jgi:hypothetical protein